MLRKKRSATEVRREFLKTFDLNKGREGSRYTVMDFSRINAKFEESGSILKTPVKRAKTKRTAENVMKLNEMLDERKKINGDHFQHLLK